MFQKFIFIVIAGLFFVSSALTQAIITAPTPTPTPDLPTIISEAAKQSENYRLAFKNLLAVETKTTNKYDKTGSLKNSHTVESDFLVYQSAKDVNSISELRNVTKVDGKLVPDSQKRSNELFAELQKSSTLKKELEKIQKDSARYDDTLEIYGVTLSQAVALKEKFQSYFSFNLVNTETSPEGGVYVVSYVQTKKSPYILLNSKDKNNEESLSFDFSVPGSLKKKDAFLRGKLWIDAQTFRVRREERELFVQPENPVVLLSNVFEYQPSNYDINVPKSIVLTTNSIKKKDKNFTVSKDIEASFNYSKFRKTETDVKILDDE